MAKDIVQDLTEDQKALIPIYRDRYRDIGLSTAPTNVAAAEKSIKDLYAYFSYREPEVIWADSPFVGAVLAAAAACTTDINEIRQLAIDLPKDFSKCPVSKEQSRAQANEAAYGSFESYWVSFYSFLAEQFPTEKKDNLIDIANAIIKDCGVYWTFESLAIITHKPVKISMRDGKLHGEDGMALEYRDGHGVCAIDGVVYPSLLEAKLQHKLGKVVKELA